MLLEYFLHQQMTNNHLNTCFVWGFKGPIPLKTFSMQTSHFCLYYTINIRFYSYISKIPQVINSQWCRTSNQDGGRISTLSTFVTSNDSNVYSRLSLVYLTKSGCLDGALLVATIRRSHGYEQVYTLRVFYTMILVCRNLITSVLKYARRNLTTFVLKNSMCFMAGKERICFDGLY